MDVNQKKQVIEGLELVTVEKFVVPKDELKKFYLQEAVMHYKVMPVRRILNSKCFAFYNMICKKR